MPADFSAEMDSLVAAEFADLVFFDRTKRAMVSIEQLTSVSSAAYLARQADLDRKAMEALVARGFGVGTAGCFSSEDLLQAVIARLLAITAPTQARRVMAGPFSRPF